MAKTKPIGIRFTEEIVKHFNEVHKVKGHQTMFNYLWTFYAQKAGLLNGSVSVANYTNEKETNYSVDNRKPFADWLSEAKSGFIGDVDERRFRKQLSESHLTPGQKEMIIAKIHLL